MLVIAKFWAGGKIHVFFPNGNIQEFRSKAITHEFMALRQKFHDFFVILIFTDPTCNGFDANTSKI